MNLFIKWIIFGVIGSSLFACSPKILIQNGEKLERRKTNELVETLDSITLQKPTFFYSKISTKFKDTTQSLSFKTSIRMVRDSAMSAIITYASIPVFSSLLTKDELTIVNKRSKCYNKEKLSYFKENFGVNFDYKNVEELLLGLPLAYDTNQRYFQIHDPYNYIISSHRKRDIRKTEKKDLEDIIIKYYLSNDAKNIKRIDLESPSDSTRVQVYYLEREMVQGFSIPKTVMIQIFTAKNKMDIEMNYEKVELIERPEIFVVIPESYEICE